MNMSDKIYTEVTSSKINSPKHEINTLTTRDIIKISEKVWKRYDVEIYNKYKQGFAYANNNPKKDIYNLLRDMLSLLQQTCKESSNTPDQVNIIFDMMKSGILLLQKQEALLDKDQTLSQLHGYIISCLKDYDKKSTN